jgi:hypothetical protein
MNLVSLNEAPFSKHTGYKWHTKNRHPGLILKVGGKLFVDLDEWLKMAERERTRQIKASKRIHREA